MEKSLPFSLTTQAIATDITAETEEGPGLKRMCGSTGAIGCNCLGHSITQSGSGDPTLQNPPLYTYIAVETTDPTPSAITLYAYTVDSKDKPELKFKPLSASCRSPPPLQRPIPLQYTEQRSTAAPLPPTKMPSTCYRGHNSGFERDSVPPASSRETPQTLPKCLEKQGLSIHTLLFMPSLRVPSYI